MTNKQLTTIVQERYDAADRILSTKRDLWAELEDIYHCKLNDSLSLNVTKSRVFDPRISNALIERSGRVMSQLPTGKVRPISKNDRGLSILMNLCLDKYVIPNANAQFDFLTKLRLLDLYSNIYGNMFALVDWDIKRNGYVGPDMWLLNIRDVFPQVGAVSLDDSDYVIVRTWKSLDQLKYIAQKNKQNDKYKNAEEIIEKLEKKSGDKHAKDAQHKSQREDQQYDDNEPAKGKGYFQVLSMYERDRWVDYIPDAEGIWRDDKNAHDNGELPLVNKYAIPLLDDFFGMSDAERGKSMQYTDNSLWNLYLDAIKVSIFPPVLLDKNAIIPSTIKFGPAERWLFTKSIQGSVDTLRIAPQGIQSFNNTKQLVDASLLNIFGTTDTTVASNVDPGFGRTPQALQIQNQRQNTRDNWDRFYMEKTLENIYRKFTNLISKKSSGSIKVRMFSEEITALATKYPEVAELYNEETGEIEIGKDKYGSVMFDYEIVSGSTYELDQSKQTQNLLGFINMVSTNQALEQRLYEEGKKVNYSKLIEKIIANSGITEGDEIIVDTQGEGQGQNPQDIVNQVDQAFGQMFQGSGMEGIPVQPQFNGQTPIEASQGGGVSF